MIVYTVVIQSIAYDGHQVNSVENFKDLEAAKKFIDSCVAIQKTLEGDVFMEYDLTNSMCEYGWIFSGKIPYGIELSREAEGKPHDYYKTKRFIIPTLMSE